MLIISLMMVMLLTLGSVIHEFVASWPEMNQRQLHRCVMQYLKHL